MQIDAGTSGGGNDAPAPWELAASGYILVLRLPERLLDTQSFTPEELRPFRVGRYAYAMFVDYSSSPVGPYHELLFIPGAFRGVGQDHWSITKIYVSSPASMLNGRRNWGMPKELARFEVEYGKHRCDRIHVLVSDQPAVELTLRHHAFGVPLRSALVPARLRTLTHVVNGRRFTVTPSANGRIRAARLVSSRIDSRFFPPFDASQVRAAVKVADVHVTFPKAVIDALKTSRPRTLD
jgi:hypothetical protein